MDDEQAAPPPVPDIELIDVENMLRAAVFDVKVCRRMGQTLDGRTACGAMGVLRETYDLLGKALAQSDAGFRASIWSTAAQ